MRELLQVSLPIELSLTIPVVRIPSLLEEGKTLIVLQHAETQFRWKFPAVFMTETPPTTPDTVSMTGSSVENSPIKSPSLLPQ